MEERRRSCEASPLFITGYQLDSLMSVTNARSLVRRQSTVDLVLVSAIRSVGFTQDLG